MDTKDTVQETDATEEVADTEVEEAPEPVEEEGEETTEDSSSQEEIDYEAIAEEEEKRKPDLEKAKEAFKKRQEKKETSDEAPLTREELLSILEQNNAQTQKTLTQNHALEIAKSFASSDAEANAIIAKWNNRVFPQDMPIQEQIEEMHAAVNRSKLVSTNAELARALKNKESVARDTASTHKDAPEGDAPKLSSADAQAYKSAGFVWDGGKRLYKKPLGNGKKFLYKNPISKEQWVE